MNDRTRLVFAGFLKLTPSEQADFIRAVKDYYDKSESEQRTIEGFTERQATKAVLGPLDSGCPCCGR
jgi:hypothetical protein